MEKENVSIIDGDSITYIAGYSKKENENGEKIEKNPIEIISSVDSIIESILKETKADYYIGVVSGIESNYEKLRISGDYKKNRDQKLIPRYINFIKEYLVFKWRFNKSNYVETDDTVYGNYKFYRNDYNCTVVGNDKDYLTVPISYYDWKKRINHSITPEKAVKNLFSMMIIGDQADNIKGLFGKGEKYVQKIFDNQSDYPSIVFSEYIKYYNDYNTAINEFHKNYFLLKIKEEDVKIFEIEKVNK
jgi:hypothetical protein